MTGATRVDTPAGSQGRISLVAAAIVPSAPVLLPDVSPDQRADLRAGVARLRTAVARTLAPVADAAVVVLIAAGTQPGVHTRTYASLAALGARGVSQTLPTDTVLVGLLTAELATLDDDLDLDLSVLAGLVAGHGRPTVAVTVPADGEPDVLATYADVIGAAINAHAAPVAVVGAGDLSACRDATSPGYLHLAAVGWDDDALAAVRGDDPTALGKLGPDAAHEVLARSWASLLVTWQLARDAGLRTEHATVHAPLGVGYLVASLTAP